MAKHPLEHFFDELLSGAGSTAARQQARAAVMAQNRNADAVTLADIAAHIDPASGRDETLISKLADDPDAVCEVESAEAYLEKLASYEQPVPATLLRLAGAAPAADNEVRLPQARLRLVSPRRKPLLLWGGAIAATVLAGITGYAVHDHLDRNDARIASAVPVQSNSAGRRAVAPETNSVTTQQVSPSETLQNPAMPPVYTAPNAPVPISSHAVGAGDYPPESVQLQEQGTVKVKYLVLADGTVGNCQVEISSGFARLDDAACVLVRRWLFKPASVMGGSPVEWWLDTSIVYQLRGNSGFPPPPPSPPIATTTHAVTADDYPPASIRLQEQGRVGIKYLVKEDGTVGDCSVTRSSGLPRLDDAACAMATKRWTFKPAMQNGKPVAEYLVADVVFQLK